MQELGAPARREAPMKFFNPVKPHRELAGLIVDWRFCDGLSLWNRRRLMKGWELFQTLGAVAVLGIAAVGLLIFAGWLCFVLACKDLDRRDAP